jgi:hypothetical protein
VVAGVTTDEPLGAFKTTLSKISPDDLSTVSELVWATKPTSGTLPSRVKPPSDPVKIEGSLSSKSPSPS